MKLLEKEDLTLEEVKKIFDLEKRFKDKVKEIKDSEKYLHYFKVITSARFKSYSDEQEVCKFLTRNGYNTSDFMQVKKLPELRKSILPAHSDEVKEKFSEFAAVVSKRLK